MKILLTLFVLFFSSLLFAEDISDFQIEGMSIGDSLLDHFNERELKEDFVKGLYSSENDKFIIYEIEDYTLNPRSRLKEYHDLKFDAIPILRKLKDARKYAQHSYDHYESH